MFGHVSLKSKPQDTGKVTVKRRVCKHLVRRKHCIQLYPIIS